MWYLTPNAAVAPRYRRFFGVFETLGSMHIMSGVPVWGMDNGRFNPNGASINPRWTEAAWLSMLGYYRPEDRARCAFSVVPDAPYDKRGTLALYGRYVDTVCAFGYPPALATQDGMMPDDIPWPDVGALFIGGSDEHKLGVEALHLIDAAKERGLWVHVGRVNSMKRIKQFWRVDSVDGRMLAFNSAIARQRLLAEAVSFCRALKRQEMLPCM